MFPSGFPNFGEHPAETLKREVREETGLDVTAYNLVNVFQSEDDPRLLGHFVFLYDVAVGGGKPTTDQEENEAIGWFSTMRPPLVAWKLHRMALEALQRDGSLNSLRNV
jgi:ADP-ribose pyrophosphatase YjhB (NUDIX family)